MKNRKYRILFVDDEEKILKSLKRIFFKFDYDILTAQNGQEGINVLKNNDIDLIVADYRMPEMNGVDFLNAAKKIKPNVLRFMLTGYSDIMVTISAINQGAIHRYITKPWDNKELVALVRNALEKGDNFENDIKLEIDDKKIEEEMLQISNSLKKANFETIKALSNVIEGKDKYMKGHCERVSNNALIIGYKLSLTSVDILNLKGAALLHDIGMIGIPSEILNKKHEITQEEREIIERHPNNGAIITRELHILSKVSRIILEHHERYDGNGYPYGKKGNEILVESRIISVVDVYDVLISERPFRQAMSKKQAISFLISEKGKMFDPQIVDIFLEEPEIKTENL